MGMNLNEMQYLQYLITLHQAISNNADTSAPPDGSNTLIQFFDAPYDQLTLSALANGYLIGTPGTTFEWGGTGITSNFTWDNGGVWDSFVKVTKQYTDKLTFASSVTTNVVSPSNLYWGGTGQASNWQWSLGAVWG